MMTAAGLATVGDELDQILNDIRDAVELITELPEPHLDESLTDLHRRLLITRSAMTRISALLAKFVRARGIARKMLIDARGELETANAGVVQRPTFGHANFASGDERRANLAFATIEERRAVRQAEKLVEDIEAALEYGRTHHRELDRSVRDVETRMRIMTWEPNIS